ncbi:MAG: pentapeptide repeat-containing protein, partial [Phormidesmis sp.]
MADSLLTLLKSSVNRWNQWRLRHPGEPCCLAGVDLSKGYFYEADFSSVDLSGANLSRACLIGANFQNANLTGANLSNAYVNSADFRGAVLEGAQLAGANVGESNMAQTAIARASLDSSSQAVRSQTTSQTVSSKAVLFETAPNKTVPSKTVSSEAVLNKPAPNKPAPDKTVSDKPAPSKTVPDIAQSKAFRPNQRPKRSAIWLPALATVGVLMAVAMSGIASVDRPRQLSQTNAASTGLDLDATQSPETAQLASSRSIQPVGNLSLVKSLEGSSQVWAVDTYVRSDGHVVVVGGNSAGQVKIWDAPTGEILHTLSDHNDTIRALALSSAG